MTHYRTLWPLAFHVSDFKIVCGSAHKLTLDEALTMMVDRESLQRKNKRVERLLKAAKLRYPHACVSAIDYSDQGRFNADQMRETTRCEWLSKNKNIIINWAYGHR